MTDGHVNAGELRAALHDADEGEDGAFFTGLDFAAEGKGHAVAAFKFEFAEFFSLLGFDRVEFGEFLLDVPIRGCFITVQLFRDLSVATASDTELEGLRSELRLAFD